MKGEEDMLDQIFCSADEFIKKYLYDIYWFFWHGRMQRIWDNNLSKMCQGSVVFPFTKLEMMSLAVYNTTQKNCGGFHHPICNAVVTTSSVSPRETCRP